MKQTNKLISILLVLAMLLSLAPLSLTASAADIEVYATGTLGSGSRTAWTIYDNGLLVIDGKGNSISTKWDSTTASPWKDYADIITRVSFVNCENWECIPECTFRSLSKLKDVTLPENIEEICQYAFTGTAIETILLPDGLITIGYYAFSSCESLKYININDGVTSIGSSAFYNCSSLKAISIPDSVTSIGQTLFQNCTNLEYVRLSENADKVGGSMFSGCTMLKNVSLPASVTVIGSKAFSNASNLEGIYYHGINEPTTYNPGINNATFSLAPDTMVIYASNDYSATTMGLKANWENDVQTVTKIEGHFVNIAHTANGAVKVGASIVPAGDTVTIDIMAYKNYELDTITVTDSNGQVELSGSGHSRTFSMPEGDVRISATFKSTATPHVHSWTYAANGATITATCAYADTCHNPISKVEISKGNTSSLTFRPDNAKYMTVSGTMEDVVIPDLVYTLKSTGEPTTPINPGVYVASLTIENVTATYEFEITRGNFNYTYFTYTAPQNLTYDGTPKYASVVMSEDYVPYAGEYTVYYNSGTTEPINAGTYTVKVNVAESDYFTAGTAISGRAWRFNIVPKSIEDLTYEGLGTSYPVGATPDVTIKHGDMVLVKDTDYTVEYANNTELGTATMTVTGVGNYTGSKTLEFEICSHTHSFTYSASGDTITAVCANTDGNCPDSEGTLTILAPADLYVDGTTAKEATVENNLVDTSVAVDITYSTADGSAPTTEGTYTASVTVGGATATVEFTLSNYAAKVTDKDGNEIEGSPFKTLEEAADAVRWDYENATITLLDDITLDSTWSVGGVVTIDLNGKTLNCTSGDTIFVQAFNGFAVTVEDSSENKTGVIRSETGSAIDVGVGSKFILNSGTITAENDYAIMAAYRESNHSLLEVNGGTVNGMVFCYADSVVSGGTFNDMFAISYYYKQNKFSGGIFNGGIKINSSDSLNDILADGYHFRNAQGKVVDGSSEIIEEKVTIEKGADFSADAVVTAEDVVYNGAAQESDVTVTIGGKTLTEGKDYTVAFANNINAGKATVTVTSAGDYEGEIVKTFEIKKADSSIDVYPEANKLTYNGEARTLVTAGSTVNGTIVYSLDGEKYSPLAPTGTNVGEYTVYYKVIGDANHNDTEAETIIVTINKANASVRTAPTARTVVYNGFAQALVNAGSAMGGEMQYSLDGETYSDIIPVATDAGDYTVYYKVVGDENHNGSVTETLNVTIAKRRLTVSATVADKVYDGTIFGDKSTAVITFDGLAEGDTISYTVKNVIFIDKNAGSNKTVYVAYSVNGDNAENYEFPVDGVAIPENEYYFVETKASISQKPVTATAVVADKVYDGTVDIDPDDIEISFEGIVDSDDVVCTQWYGRFFDANVGNNKTVYVSYFVSGEDVENYDFHGDFYYIPEHEGYGIETTASITKKPVTVSATVPDRIYGDDYNADTSKVVLTFDGIIDGDDVGYVVTDATYHVHTVTDNAPVQVVYNVNGADAGNYQFPEYGDWMAPNYGVQATGKVLPRDIAEAEVILGDALIYNGTEQTQSIASVIVNGIDATFDVSGNTATNVGVYELTITGNGNFTGTKTAAFEIAPDTSAIDVLTVDNVKTTDKEAIEAVAKQIENAETDLADEETKAEYKAIADKCEALFDKISETEEKLEKIKGVENNFNPEKVTSDDKAEIEEIIAEIESVNPENLTDEQKAEYYEIKAEFEALLEEIEKAGSKVDAIGAELEMFNENRVTIFWEDEIEALKAKIDELLTDENMGETEKAKLNEYKAQCDNLIEIINAPVKYFSMRFFYFVWDTVNWLINRIVFIFNRIF